MSGALAECIKFLTKKTNDLTINVPLILKVREIIFVRANRRMKHFEGFFKGAKTFLTPKLS
jgi:hypothetical protein